jgi:hypothetical protein
MRSPVVSPNQPITNFLSTQISMPMVTRYQDLIESPKRQTNIPNLEIKRETVSQLFGVPLDQNNLNAYSFGVQAQSILHLQLSELNRVRRECARQHPALIEKELLFRKDSMRGWIDALTTPGRESSTFEAAADHFFTVAHAVERGSLQRGNSDLNLVSNKLQPFAVSIAHTLVDVARINRLRASITKIFTAHSDASSERGFARVLREGEESTIQVGLAHQDVLVELAKRTKHTIESRCARRKISSDQALETQWRPLDGAHIYQSIFLHTISQAFKDLRKRLIPNVMQLESK